MDGSGREVLHNSSLVSPWGITLDYESQTLYWVDYSLNRLESSKTNGSARTYLTAVNDPFDITYFNGMLYWTDFYSNRILSVSLSSPGIISVLSSNVGYDPYGIHVISEDTQPEGLYQYVVLITSISVTLYALLCDFVNKAVALMNALIMYL